MEHAWDGVPGISDYFNSCRRNWSKIVRAVRPSAELALANVLQTHGNGQKMVDPGQLKGRVLESHADIIQSAFQNPKPAPQNHPGQIPGIVNLNIAGAGM